MTQSRTLLSLTLIALLVLGIGAITIPTNSASAQQLLPLEKSSSPFSATLTGGVTDLGRHDLHIITRDGTLTLPPLTQPTIKFEVTAQIVSSQVTTIGTGVTTPLGEIRLAISGVTGQAALHAEGTSTAGGTTTIDGQWTISQALGLRNPFTPTDTTFLPSIFIANGQVSVDGANPVAVTVQIIPVANSNGVGVSSVLVTDTASPPTLVFTSTAIKYRDDFFSVLISGALGGDFSGSFDQKTDRSLSNLVAGTSKDKGQLTLAIAGGASGPLGTVSGPIAGSSSGLPLLIVSTGTYKGEQEQTVKIDANYELHWSTPWTFTGTLTGTVEKK